MISDQKAEEIVLFIYRVLFLLADPPINFDKVLKKNKAGALEDNWFDGHSLSIDTQDDIIKRVAKIYGLRPYERERLKTQIHLGCSPHAVWPSNCK